MTWLEIWDSYINIAPGMAQIAIRLACAMLVGFFIGLEREFTHRPAGLRTHILVALGACAVSITGEMLFHHFSALGSNADPARLSAQVITGVGFLGAGTIMKEGVNVKGLTTAASVWSVACLGIAAGFGYYALAILGMLFIFITLTLVEALQHRFIHVYSSCVHYVLETTDLTATLSLLHDTAQQQRVSIQDLCAQQTEDGHQVSFLVEFSGRRKKKHHQRFFQTIATAKHIRSVQQADSKAGTAV